MNYETPTIESSVVEGAGTTRGIPAIVLVLVIIVAAVTAGIAVSIHMHTAHWQYTI